MSNISLEQIDIIIQRTNVSYATAKEALEHCNGDVVEALLYIEKMDQIKTKKPMSHTDNFSSFMNSLNATTFILKKKDHVYVDVPLSIALIIIILCFHVSLIALIISLIFGVKIYIQGENELANKINSAMDNMKRD